MHRLSVAARAGLGDALVPLDHGMAEAHGLVEMWEDILHLSR
jgi:hypothetical protein